ncbi:dUTPase [Halalkalibacterium halodurans]|uniref:dUTP diphosphatase n=1 Tax=Halalkalibacterium halodurans TaxID=86665 RepID=UPI0010678B2A|nr:dUTP diphosphatase [Halalkalibacterium halodurans]TES58191.1 dUTPase [Halalkalibacterium halodurans]
MNLNKLFTLQQTLNERIQTEHGLTGYDLFHEQLLALKVELGELANETRCFKYWSKKGPSPTTVILEEYVDGLHFVLTLGLTLRMTDVEIKQMDHETNTLTEQFLLVFRAISELEQSRTEQAFRTLFSHYIALGEKLNFSTVEIERAYLDKNKVNHQRQDEGY